MRDQTSTAITSWRAPLCRRPDEHPEVDHNWTSLAKLGKTCSCTCHVDAFPGDTGHRPRWFCECGHHFDMHMAVVGGCSGCTCKAHPPNQPAPSENGS